MKNLLLAVVLSSIVCACGRENSSSDTNDTGYIYRNQIDAHVLYRAGDLIFLGYCPAGTVFPTRVACGERLKGLDWTVFVQLVQGGYWRAVQDAERERSDVLTLVDDLDRKIEIMLAAEPDYVSDLAPQITTAADRVQECTARLQDLRLQEARIQDELRSGSDGDLVALLASVRAKIAAASDDCLRQQAELNRLRSRQLEQNASIISTATFVRLVRTRKAALERYDSSENRLAWSLKRLEGCLTAFKMIEDGETWILNGRDRTTDLVADAVGSMDLDFNNLQSPYLQPVGGIKHFLLAVPDRTVSELYLVNKSNFGACRGFQIRFGTRDIYLAGNEHRFGKDQAPEGLAWLFAPDLRGMIEVRPVCQEYGVDVVEGRLAF